MFKKRRMNEKSNKRKPARSKHEKTSLLGKSQGIPLDFRVKFKRNLSRKKLRKTIKNDKKQKNEKDYQRKYPIRTKSCDQTPKTKGE